MPLFTHSSLIPLASIPLSLPTPLALAAYQFTLQSLQVAGCRCLLALTGEREGEGELYPAPCLRISISNSSRLLFPSLSASLPLPYALSLSAGNLYEELCVCSTFFAASRLICSSFPPAPAPCLISYNKFLITRTRRSRGRGGGRTGNSRALQVFILFLRQTQRQLQWRHQCQS